MNYARIIVSTPRCAFRRHRRVWIVAALACIALLLQGGGHPALAGTARHVIASGGTASGTAADSAHGWTLAWALNAANTTLSPGDTVWIHAGTYSGTYTATRSGSSGSPIIYRVRPGQRATIDAGSPFTASATLGINAAYIWVWGLEIMSSATTKAGGDATYGNFSWPDNIAQPEGIVFLPTDGSVDLPGVRIIRCIIHDTKQGYSHWKGGRNSEVTDCVFYDNGWYDTNGDAHGHNWYIQTQPMNGTVKFTNNINERSYDNAFQLYGSASTYGDSVYVENNIFSQCGSNVGIGNGRNGFFGPGNVGHDDVYRGNVSYTDMAINLLVCSGNGTPGTDRFTMTNNLMWGQGSALTFQTNAEPTIKANKIFYGGGAPESTLPANSWTTTKPTTWDTTIVHPFTYEKGANVVVVNVAGATTRAVDFSSFLSSGDAYTVLDAQNYYGPPIASGTYAGGTVSLPLTGTALPAVVGNDPRQYHHTSKEFNVFVVVAGGAVSCQAPTLTASACNVTPTSFQLDCAIDPNGYTTSYHVDYGVTPAYGSSTTSASAGSGFVPVAVSEVLNGLASGTQYHYRVVASNTGGTTMSGDQTLTTSPAPLPIQLSSFTAIPDGASRTVALRWVTSSEIDNFGFYVQRSTSPASGFADLPGGFVPGSGTSAAGREYSWLDRDPLPGTTYYILKQVDLDGNSRVSAPQQVFLNPATAADNASPATVFALNQNYPNPFNPATRISFGVDKAGYTTLKVYNVLGEAVATLFDGLAETGRTYDVTFDGSSLATGAYFYRLVNGGHTALKRMALVK